MIYRCLVHKPSNTYAGLIAGSISDWSGLAKEPDAWEVVEVELVPTQEDYEVELQQGLIVMASVIDSSLIGGAQ